MAETMLQDAEELEGDVDVDDLDAWLVLDEDSGDMKENGKQIVTQKLSQHEKKDQKEKSQATSKPPVSSDSTESTLKQDVEKGNSIQPEMEPSNSENEKKHSGNKTVTENRTQTSTKSSKTVKSKGKVAQTNYLFSDIGDIAGLMDTIDSSQHVVSVKKGPKKKSTKSSSSSNASVTKALSSDSVVVPNEGAGLKQMNEAEVTDSINKEPEATPNEPSSVVKANEGESNGEETPMERDEKQKEETEPVQKKPVASSNQPSPAVKANANTSNDRGTPVEDDKTERKETSSGQKKPESSPRRSSSTVKTTPMTPSLNPNSTSRRAQNRRTPQAAVHNKESPISEEEKEVFLTDPEMKEIDDWLVSHMFSDIETPPAIAASKKITMTISPLEIADLADPLVQNLIEGQPTISFCFKKQAVKFKKKKGYAQLFFYNSSQFMKFLPKLLYISTKSLSSQLEVTISVEHSREDLKDFTGSFKLDMNKADNLAKVVKASLVPVKPKPPATRQYFVVENLPRDTTFFTCKLLFPFSTYIGLDGGESEEKEGDACSAKVFYRDKTWRDGILECCSDFVLDGRHLTIGVDSMEEDSKEEETPTKESESNPKAMEVAGTDESMEVTGSEEGREERSEVKEIEVDMEVGNKEADEGIASMTRDVCSTMMESLNKLKQLEADNPNVQKILEMQAQLSKLQESLLEKESKSSEKPLDKRETPVLAASDSANSPSCPEPSAYSVPIAKKQRRIDKEVKEMELAEQFIQTQADEDQRQFDRIQQMKEEQRLEQERKRKASWAKKLIEESKDDRGSKETKTKSVTQDAQRLLKMRKEKLEKERVSQGETSIEEEERKKLTAVEEKRREKERKEEEERRERELKEEEVRRRKEQELRAQQQLREELERAAQKQSESPSNWDPKAILQTFQETFSSLSESLPENVPGRSRASQNQEQTDVDNSNGSPMHISSKRPSTDPGMAESGAEKKHQKLDEEKRVISEQDFSAEFGHLPVDDRPKNVLVKISYFKGRRCPVESCPTSTSKTFVFKTSFTDHWETFHRPNMTVKFCQKCSAYFSQEADLKNHMKNLHHVTDKLTVDKLVSEARSKVVTNPSFRDPWPYIV